jgi:GGDEF domain-containing protein
MTHVMRRLESNRPVESALYGPSVERPEISWGVASFPTDAAEENELIRIADDRLYACKGSHRRDREARGAHIAAEQR